MLKLKTLAFVFLVGISASVAAQQTLSPRRLPIRRSLDNCGYFIFAIGTYGDWSELFGSISFCLPSGTVNGCAIQPDCNNGQPLPAVQMGPGEGTINLFGFSPWAGFSPCEAITHADAFVCPVSMLAPTDPIFTPLPGRPDVEPPTN